MATRLNIDAADLAEKAQSHPTLVASVAAAVGAYLAGLRKKRKAEHPPCVDVDARADIDRLRAERQRERREFERDRSNEREALAHYQGDMSARMLGVQEELKAVKEKQGETNDLCMKIAGHLGVDS